MAHRALTLKYRPQVFADMVGQDHVTTVLMRSIESGRVAHAYLFTGARGVGKTTCARILAKALDCQRRAAGVQKGADPCNACTSCLEITSGVSLDVVEIDGASNRGIADVQALRERVRFTPTGGKYRVVIIDEVHQLSNDAFAALLKTLEEPPPHLVFIFATTDPQKLPETIRSRCQRFDFARVPLRKVAERLFEIRKREAEDPEGVKFDLTEGAAFLIAHKSEGSMRDAVSALDQVVSAGETAIDEELVRRVLGIADREAFFQIAGAILARDPQATLRHLHEAFTKGLDPRDLAEGLAEHLRDVLVLKVDAGGAELVAASGEELVRLEAQGQGWTEGDLLRLLKIIAEVPQVMKDSPQPLVHLEAAMLQMATIEAGETLAAILERLESLERRLNGAGESPRPASSAPRVASGSVRPGGAGGSGMRAAPATEPRSFAAPATPAGSTRATAGPVAAAPAGPIAPMRSIADPAPVMAAPVTAATAVLEAPADAPATPALPATEGLPDAERAALLWREVIGRVNVEKRMLGAFLEEGRFGGIGEHGLLLETDHLHATVIDEKENRGLVLQAIRAVFGAPLGFRCVRPSQPLPSAVRRTNADVKPMIDQAIAFFEGEAVDLTPRPAPAPPRREFRKEKPFR